jgi:hypothetical protein
MKDTETTYPELSLPSTREDGAPAQMGQEEDSQFLSDDGELEEEHLSDD